MIIKIISIIVAITLPLYSYANNIHFHISANDLKHAESAIYLAEQEKWNEALYAASISRDKIIRKFILWMKYLNKQNQDFPEITDFINKNPDWPNIKLLTQNAENSINSKIDIELLYKWFQKHEPITGNGYKYNAITNSKFNIYNADTIKLGWVRGSFTEQEENEYISKFDKYITYNDHIDRINELLLQKRITQVKRMLYRFGDQYQKLINSRINIILNNDISDIRYLDHNVRKDIGLSFDLLNYYNDTNDNKKIIEILKSNIFSEIYSDKIWKIRVKQVRNLISEKSYSLAYNIVKNHNTVKPDNYIEGEWLSGWISHSFLNNSDIAYKHFNNLYKISKSPISKSRGAYWLARSIEKKDKSLANDWYKKSAKYNESFYGQLSMNKLGYKYINMQNNPVITAADLAKCKNNELVKMAYIAAKINKLAVAENIIKSLITSVKSAGEAALISKMFTDINRNHLSVLAAKEANRKGLQIIKYSHPLIKHVDHVDDIEKSLILAVIRQESVFNESAKSNAGAMGLMQILPNTASELSNELNLLYKTNNLTIDSKYNITIGSHYLKKILKYFDGSYILTIASYNAGMTNVKKWIEERGDPRYYNDIDDIIEWIETIPFYETRNYVQRVIENIQIYRLILSKKNQTELNIENDLITDFIL